MPKGTQADLFIENALRDEPMTPFAHSQHRPMLFVDVQSEDENVRKEESSEELYIRCISFALQ
jgi:hypothetical protein